MGSRTEQLTELAREAFGEGAVIDEDFGEQHLRIYRNDGAALLEVRHPLADEALAVLARKPGVMSIAMALDCAEIILRRRANRHGLDVAGLRDGGRIMFWTDEGCVATGGSLRDAIANLDKRREAADSIEPLPELDDSVATLQRIEGPLPPGLRRIESAGPPGELRSVEDREGEGDTLDSLEHEAHRLQFEGKRLADVGERLVQKLEVDSIKRARRAARYVADQLRATLVGADPAAALARYQTRVDEILHALDIGDRDLEAAFDDVDGEVP